MVRADVDELELDRGLDERRLLDVTRRLVAVPSHSGEETAMAMAYAELLREAGATVVLDETFAGSPSVVARVGGGREQRRAAVQLAGHLDTIPSPHPPPRVRDGRIYGRGACDMKAGLAVIAEVVRVVAPIVRDSDAGLLVTAYGLHEGPGSAPMHAPLRDLIQRGIVGDAVIVCEGPKDAVPIAGKGSLVFKVRISRPGVVEHEILHVGAVPNPLTAAHEFLSRLAAAASEWTAQDDLLGGETYFVGAVHGGDLYNRIPVEARIEGTRRYPGPRTFGDVTAELVQIGREVQRRHGVRVELSFDRAGQPFAIDPSTSVVRALRSSYADVTGVELALGGQLFSSDINHFVTDARVPVAAHGPDPSRAHATPESVALADVVRCARVVLRTTLRSLAPLASSPPGFVG